MYIYTLCVCLYFNLFGKGNLEKVQNFKSIWQHFGANKPWTPSSVSTRLPAKILSNLWRYAARRFRGCVWTVILWLLPLSTQCHTNRKHRLLESGGKKNVALHYFGPHHFPLHSDLYSPRLQPAKGSGKGYVELSFFPPFFCPPSDGTADSKRCWSHCWSETWFLLPCCVLIQADTLNTENPLLKKIQ